MANDSNPTFQYATGAVHVYARVGHTGATMYLPGGTQAGAVEYLGTCEKAPEEDKVEVWEPYHNSIGGNVVPMDETFHGVVADIRLDLNRYSNTVLRKLRSSPHRGRDGLISDGGFQAVGDVGKQLIAHGRSFELWLVHAMWLFRAQATNIAAFPDLEPGTYYKACRLERVFEGRKGISPQMVYLEAKAQRIYDARSRSFFTYSSDPQFFANLPFPV